MLKLRFNNKGVSLIELITVLGVMAVTLGVTTAILESVGNIKSKISDNADLNGVFQIVQLAIGSEKACQSLIIDAATSKSPILKNGKLPKVKLQIGGSSILEEGLYISPDMRVKTGGINTVVEKMQSQSRGGKSVFPLEITVDFEMNKKAIGWSDFETKKFSIFIVVDDQTGNVDGCYKPDIEFQTAIAVRKGFAIETMGCSVTDGNSGMSQI